MKTVTRLIVIFGLLALPAAAQLGNATSFRGRPISATAPTNGQVYAYNSSTRRWEPGGGAGGGDALVANPLSQFAATTSAQLRSVLSDEAGTGVSYFVGGALGTPVSGVGTNFTGTAAGLTAGAATVLATTRSIYGNNFDGSAALTQVIAPSFGGTNSAFFGIAGPASSIKTWTIPNQSINWTSLSGVVVLTAGVPSVVTGTATDCVLVNGTSGACGSGGSSAFSAITGSTNTTAAMVVGAGATFGYTSTGTIDASHLGASAAALYAKLASPTFTGTVVFPSGQAFIAPLLGTPTSGVMTNVTGTAAGLTAGAATALASNPTETSCSATTPTTVTAIDANGNLTCTSIQVATDSVPGILSAADHATFAAGSGGGDVDGPASATDNACVRFDGTTGKLVQNSTSCVIDDTGNAAFASVTTGDGTVAGGVSLFELTANGSNFRKWLVPDTLTASLTMTFPNTVPAAGDVLTFGAPSSDISTMAFVSSSGTGNFARVTSPVFVTPLLGTPTSGVMTNVTGTAAGLTAGAATALVANGANCSGNNFALGVDASGVCEGAQPAFSNLSGAATDAQVPDTITTSNYLPLVGGTLTGQLITDNLAIEFEESDTNPSCGAGNYNIYADLSETALKMCNNGVASVLGAGGSGITTLNTLTGATQTFATPGTTGTAPNWVSSGTSHTMHIPLASAAGVTAGLVTKAWWDTVVLDSTLGGLLSGVYPTLAGPNTFTGNNIMTPTATTESVRLIPSTRPSAPGAGALNVSAAGEFEWYDGSAWQVAGTAAGAPTNATYITQTPNGSLSAEQALSALATGILKNTTTTGVLSIAVAGDFPTLNQNTTGSAAAATVLATTRAIYGNNFDGSAALAQVIAPTYGGTNSAFFGIAGPASSIKTWTIWNASLDWTGLTGVAKLNGASVPGVVTGTATDCVLVNGTSGACGSGGGGVSAKTGNYTTVGGDTGTLITFDGSSLTATLLATPSSTYVVGIKNLNATALTVSRNGLTINGGTSDIVLQRYQDVACYADGTNYFCEVPTVAGSNITLTPASNGMTIAGAAGGGGTVTASGTPLISQLAVWTTATDIKGIAVGANNTVLRGSTGADPAFGSLVDADIPNTITVDLASAATILATTRAIYGNNFDGSAAITGPVGIAFGGTGTASTLTGLVRGSASAMTAAELSGDCVTSGSNAVVCSQINGNNFTVSSAGLLTKINGLTTTGVGVPIVLFSTDVTAQSTSQGAVTIATSPAAGVYRISYYADMTTACTTGSNSVSFAFNWTDSGGARTLTTGSMPMGASQWVGAYLSGGPFQISVASGDITYTSTVLGTCASGTSTYEIRPVLERVK